MTTIVSAAADFSLLAFSFLVDVVIDSTPLILLMVGAAFFTIGVIAWPMKPASPRNGGGHGLV